MGDNSFSVKESIGDWSGSGGIAFIYPSGASKIGYDIRGKVITVANTVSGAIGNIDTLLSGGSSGNYLSSGGGISPNWVDDDLVRRIWKLWNGGFEGYSGSYREVSGGIFPTSVIWYMDSSKGLKIIEKLYTYNDNKTISSIVWKLYSSGGILVRTITESISYSGIFESSRVRIIS